MQVHFLDTFLMVAATVATHSAGIIMLVWCLVHYEPQASRYFAARWPS
jgi:hypothetical protein